MSIVLDVDDNAYETEAAKIRSRVQMKHASVRSRDKEDDQGRCFVVISVNEKKFLAPRPDGAQETKIFAHAQLLTEEEAQQVYSSSWNPVKRVDIRNSQRLDAALLEMGILKRVWVGSASEMKAPLY